MVALLGGEFLFGALLQMRGLRVDEQLIDREPFVFRKRPEIDPKVDYAFKKVFGSESNVDLLAHLINAVRDAVLKYHADTGEYEVIDEGVADKRLLVTETEFAQALKAIKREGNTLSPLLRAAWDGQTLEVLTRGKSKLRASNAHVSIVAHITPDELRKLLSQSVEVANGFANRFLGCMVRRSRLLPHGGHVRVLDALAQPVADALARAKCMGAVRRTPS